MSSIQCGAVAESLRLAAQLHDADAIALWRYDEDAHEFWAVSSSDTLHDRPLRVRAERRFADSRTGIVAQVSPTSGTVVYDERDRAQWRPRLREWRPSEVGLFRTRGWRSSVAILIVAQGELLGAVSAFSREPAKRLKRSVPALRAYAAALSAVLLQQREQVRISKITERYDQEFLRSNDAYTALELVHDIVHLYRSVATNLEEAQSYLETKQYTKCRASLKAAMENSARIRLIMETLRRLSERAKDERAAEPRTEDPTAVFDELKPLLRTILPGVGRPGRLLPESIDFSTEGRAHPIGISPIAFERIILNLSVNAAQWNASQIVIALHFDREDGKAHLVVSDNGTGIAPEDRGRVFDRFFSRRDGSGLGLHAVQSLTHAAGGSVYVQSVNGRAPAEQRRTTFTVVLPTR